MIRETLPMPMDCPLALPIETPRLQLRPFTRGDVDAVFAYRQRQDVARYLFDSPMSRETCEEAVRLRVSQLSFGIDGDRIVLAVERRGTGEMIGEISLIARSIGSRQGEVGYIFHPDFHHRGYATEAVRALLDAGFGALDLHRIYARCNVHNAPSYRLMERLGMRREAHFRDHLLVKGGWDDEFIYAVLADDWRTAHGMPDLFSAP
jgi:RimJ/RimL family protein N-acetyltransferase